MNELLNTVHEDERLLVLHKPAGLVCHPTKGDEYSSLISRVRLYLGDNDAGATIHLINRLDRETSGLVVVAKSDETALALRQKWERGLVEKTYVAIVEGRLTSDSGCIDAPIGPHTASQVAIKGRVDPNGAPSRTMYKRIKTFSRDADWFSVVRISPMNGRKHQIRIHLAHLGHPIVGDKIYGADEQRYLAFIDGRLTDEQRLGLRLANHALHAGRLRWVENGVDIGFYSEPEAFMKEFVDDSGEPLDWQRVLSREGPEAVREETVDCPGTGQGSEVNELKSVGRRRIDLELG